MLALIIALLMAPPHVVQTSPDVRMNSGMWLAGDGFTGATVRYDRTVTVTADNLQDEVKAALAGATIDWSKQGVDLKLETFTDQVAYCNPVLDCSGTKLSDCGAYCVPFCVRGKDGSSSSTSRVYLLNKPTIFGLPGSSPSSIAPGSLVPIVGRSLAAARIRPSVYLLSNDRSLINLPTSTPGGRGQGNATELDRSVLWVTIPADVKPGDYQLFVFHGESQWGISNLIPVTVVAPTVPNVVQVQVSSGSDVSGLISSRKSGSNIVLPPGQMILSEPIDLGSMITLQGSGINTTTLKGSLNLSSNKDKLVFDRSPMLRLTSSNITFKDLTIELTPNTTRSAIAAGPGIDLVTFENVRFLSTSPQTALNGLYCNGFIYRLGLQRYWKFVNCEFHCQQVFEARNDALSGFASSGALDYSLFHNCEFHAVHGPTSYSTMGSCLGRGSLIYGLDCHNTRRGIQLTSGDGTCESVVANCHFHDMLSALMASECILHEARGSAVGYVNQADASSFTPFGNDTQDRTRWTAAVISGKGMGQYRLIASSANGTHTLEQPWEVVPDKTSCVLISQCATDCSFVWNRFQGVIGGINLYGNSFGNTINSNWFVGSHEGIMLNTNWNSAGTSGIGGQSGDGRSIAWWSSFRGNVFEDSAAYHFIAPRTTVDLGIYKHPQIAFLSTAFTQTFGTVTSQLWAAEGTEQTGNTTSLKFPLIDYVSSSYDQGQSGKSRYLHDVIDRRPQQPLWYATASGIGTVKVGGYKWDDVPVPDGKSVQVAP